MHIMESRRRFLSRGLYVAPIILTAAVRPSFAASAYGGKGGGQTATAASQPTAGSFGDGPPWWAFWRRF